MENISNNTEELFFELEYKYKAKDIDFQKFVDLMDKMQVNNRIDVAGWDFYYTKKDSKEEFIRYRASETPELTIKKKTATTNNWERVEIDLPLNKNKASKPLIDGWVSLLGFSEKFTIYKFCSIFHDDNLSYVYYITYDKQMRELDRFIEIEVRKERVSELLTEADKSAGSFSGPRTILKDAEIQLDAIGLKAANRMKKSLFEMYCDKL